MLLMVFKTEVFHDLKDTVGVLGARAFILKLKC